MNKHMEDTKESLILQLLEATPFPESDSFQIRKAHLKAIYDQAEELVLDLSATTETVANNTIYDQL